MGSYIETADPIKCENTWTPSFWLFRPPWSMASRPSLDGRKVGNRPGVVKRIGSGLKGTRLDKTR